MRYKAGAWFSTSALNSACVSAKASLAMFRSPGLAFSIVPVEQE